MRTNTKRPHSCVYKNGARSGLAFLSDRSKVTDLNSLRILLDGRAGALKKASLVVKGKMRRFQKTGQRKPTFFEGSPSRVGYYESLYDDFVQRYVNTHSGIQVDMRVAKTKRTDGRSSVRIKRKWRSLKWLGFTKLPFVSTSEVPEHALRYAAATNDEGGTVLTPQYQADGHPRFPYLGFVYVILHPHDNGELRSGSSSRILDLKAKKLIDVNLYRRGAQRERVFIGDIDARYIPIVVVIRVPNFAHDYSSFYKEKYGLSEEDFTRFKRRLGRVRDRSGVEKDIINNVVGFQMKVLLKLVSVLAKARGGEVIYFGVGSSSLVKSPPGLGGFQ